VIEVGLPFGIPGSFDPDADKLWRFQAFPGMHGRTRGKSRGAAREKKARSPPGSRLMDCANPD
jgi:hypothetical protein